MTEHRRSDSSWVRGWVGAAGWGREERCSSSTVYREAALRPRVCLVRGSQFGGRESPSWDLKVQCVGLEGFGVRTGGGLLVLALSWRRQMPHGRSSGELAGRSACTEGCGASWINEI